MKRFLFLGCLLMGWPVLAQTPPSDPAVTVEVSRTHSLVRFVETLAGSSGYQGSRRAFEASRFNTPIARRWLRRYQSLDHEPGFDRDGYPAGRLGSMGSTEPAYLAASADAQDLPDLQRRTMGLLPNEVLVSLDSVYRYFTPAFDTLAWLPHAAELGRLRTAYADFLTKSQLMQQFGRLRTFYGSVWPDELPYRILLNPQLDVNQGFAGLIFTNHATATGNLVLLDCHPVSRTFVDGTAVVFHEMSHALSTQQRLGCSSSWRAGTCTIPRPTAARPITSWKKPWPRWPASGFTPSKPAGPKPASGTTTTTSTAMPRPFTR